MDFIFLSLFSFVFALLLVQPTSRFALSAKGKQVFVCCKSTTKRRVPLLITKLVPITTTFADQVNVTVSDAPKLIGLLDELSHPEETNATITCSVGSGDLSSLTYEWFKDEQRLFNLADKIRIEQPADNYQSALRIFNLTQQDSALYTCVASNRFGQDKIATKLVVKGKLEEQKLERVSRNKTN